MAPGRRQSENSPSRLSPALRPLGVPPLPKCCVLLRDRCDSSGLGDEYICLNSTSSHCCRLHSSVHPSVRPAAEEEGSLAHDLHFTLMQPLQQLNGSPC